MRRLLRPDHRESFCGRTPEGSLSFSLGRQAGRDRLTPSIDRFRLEEGRRSIYAELERWGCGQRPQTCSGWGDGSSGRLSPPLLSESEGGTSLPHPQRIPWAVAPVSSAGQFVSHLRCVASQHLDAPPAAHLQDVAVVHAQPLHLSSSGPTEGVNALVGDTRPAAQTANDLQDA
jgi:hypothetical protein